jgi:hypothetical protein
MVHGRKKLGGLRRRSGYYRDEKKFLPQLGIEARYFDFQTIG